ncbi:MAG TPA: M48 family metallopeptidase [Candidatus Limnocylindrales bacterium]|jgi:heat shock protein HtpX
MTGQRQSFHQQISQNRRRSVLLTVIVAGLLGLLGFGIGYVVGGDVVYGIPVLVGIVLLTFLVSIATYFSGDGIVLAASQAHEVTEQQAPQLLNVVRELSMAAGIPAPRVYLIDDTAPNAFATGRDPKHASVAVTTGLLEKLDREELQGVIGHELSHVRNLDIRFTLLVAVLVGSVALLADMFLRFSFWGGMSGRSRSRGSDGGGGAQAIIMILVLLLAILAPIAARLVQLAVSREREYLADASSVEITRNPYGLERALLKISEDREVLEVANRATQHLFIVNPIKAFEARAQGLFSTHPPIVERVNRLRVLTGAPPLVADSAEVADLD